MIIEDNIENNDEYSDIDLTENSLKLREENDRRNSEFLEDLSHEIRTTLNTIIGFSEILYSQINDVKHKNYIEAINTAGYTLLNLINDILELSKIETDIIETKLEPSNLQNRIKEINSFSNTKEIPEEVLEKLQYEVLPLINKLKLGIKGNIAKELLELILDIGNSYEIEFLSLYGKLFGQAVECFDIIKINEYLKLIEKWIESNKYGEKGKL